jgi:hypothetical protein
MGLQKFNDFVGQAESKLEKKVTSDRKKTSPKKSISSKSKEKNEENSSNIEEQLLEKLHFFGQVVKFPTNFQPSVAYKLLENNQISKQKLHYIITEQPNNSLLVVKYNEKANVRLKEFVSTLITHYQQNEQLKYHLKNILVEGNDTFSIIRQIPNLSFKGRPFIQIINDDLMSLLSKIKT